MKKLLAPSLILLALAGCAEQGAPSQQTAAVEPAPVEPVQPPAESCGAGEGFADLPAGVCLPDRFAYAQRRDYADGQGNPRLRLTFGYRGASQAETVDAVAKSLEKAGFRRREGENKPNGVVWVPFTKTELGTTYLEVGPLAESATGEAQGQFFLDFRTGTTTP
ncbi:hypothetical protein [Luteimonas wenzhouensis]|uniref:SPOR domain-containing protein n=1 Tax=Luteimonas wenzhouensis TaxID=2599615 RepID=A0A5C5TTU9_9GAMM|nr:hypothetical protein [Luteimonas wenzhouensis]TWT17611.1 hypothetical protein FQY79_12170 [Luteimonas wenzhouensis]